MFEGNCRKESILLRRAKEVSGKRRHGGGLGMDGSTLNKKTQSGVQHRDEKKTWRKRRGKGIGTNKRRNPGPTNSLTEKKQRENSIEKCPSFIKGSPHLKRVEGRHTASWAIRTKVKVHSEFAGGFLLCIARNKSIG